MAASVNAGSDIIHDFNCSPCEEEKLNNEALFYCARCIKGFCSKCVTFHNGLYKSHPVLDREKLSEWGPLDSNVAMVTCKKHGNKELEYQCKLHDVFCCKICISTGHRSVYFLCAELASLLHYAGKFAC